MISKIDRQIIKLLQKDARTTIRQIASEVNMSENGVKYRLEKLEKRGIIKHYTAIIDTDKIGKKVQAIFNIEAEPEGLEKTIVFLKDSTNFVQVFYTSGIFSIIALGLFNSHKSLTNFIKNKLLKKCNIRNYKVEIILQQYKQNVFFL